MLNASLRRLTGVIVRVPECIKAYPQPWVSTHKLKHTHLFICRPAVKLNRCKNAQIWAAWKESLLYLGKENTCEFAEWQTGVMWHVVGCSGYFPTAWFLPKYNSSRSSLKLTHFASSCTAGISEAAMQNSGSHSGVCRAQADTFVFVLQRWKSCKTGDSTASWVVV